MAWTRVQSKTGASNAGNPSVTLTLDAAPTNGNILILWVVMDRNTDAISSGPGGTWTALTDLIQAAGSTIRGQAFWRAVGAGESATVATVAVQPTTNMYAAVIEYAGSLGSLQLLSESGSVEASGQATVTTPSVTPTSGYNALIVGLFAIDADTSWSSGKVNGSTTGVNEVYDFNTLGATGCTVAAYEKLDVTLSGSYTVSADPASTTTVGLSQILVFAEGSAGGGATTRLLSLLGVGN